MREACPRCGNQADPHDPLVAACDVLVLRALELIGKRIVRADRSRFGRIEERPWHEAHLLWQPDQMTVDKGLADAWSSVPMILAEHGCCGITSDQLTVVLDRYVRELIGTMTGHAVVDLRYRLGVVVGAEQRA